MGEVLGERIFEATDGSYRLRITRNHPTSGRYKPGLRFFSFEDLEGRPQGVAGVHASGATLDLDPAQLERLLRMARRCQLKALSQRH